LGVTEIDCSTGAWHVTVVDPEPLPLVAVIIAALLTPATQVTRPPETVATLGLLVLQVAEPVTFCGEPYEKLAVAVSCSELPAASVGFEGARTTDCSRGAWQFTVVEPDPPPFIAVMVAVLAVPATHITRPPDTVATLELLEVQLAELVTFCGGPKEKLAVAVNCTELPAASVGLAGATTTEVSVGARHVTGTVPVAVVPRAEITTCCAVDAVETQVTRPPAVTVATVVFADAQLTELVTSLVD